MLVAQSAQAPSKLCGKPSAHGPLSPAIRMPTVCAAALANHFRAMATIVNSVLPKPTLRAWQQASAHCCWWDCTLPSGLRVRVRCCSVIRCWDVNHIGMACTAYVPPHFVSSSKLEFIDIVETIVAINIRISSNIRYDLVEA